MNCRSCGAENRAGRKFCVECGGRLALNCMACGTPHAAGEKFCGECGASLVENQKPAPSAAEGSKVERSQPHPSTLRDSSTSSGERRHLTVLFCDLVNSTEIAARLDPEQWHAIAAQYQRTAAAAVTRMGGHVAKYLGDGLVVYFGYPDALEDAAER